jgi:hypothetical protein
MWIYRFAGSFANLLALTGINDSSPTTAIDSASPTAFNIDTASSSIDIKSSAINIDIDTASPTIVDATASINVDTTSPTIIKSTLVLAIDSPMTTTVGPISSLTGSASTRTRGFDMDFGLFNFHVDDDIAAELISISESTLPVADPSTPLAIGGTPSTTTPLTPSEEDPRLQTSTPSVGSNEF